MDATATHDPHEMHSAVHLNLDDAWDVGTLGVCAVDARQWGPRLRYFCPPKLIGEFEQSVVSGLPRFVLYGSGDFHHLAGLFVKRVDRPFALVSFDNHPDWDVRPPQWACGGWVNRALGHGQLLRAAVWGCGNFELAFPSRLFATRNRKLEVFAWGERFGRRTRERFGCMTREDWRGRFERFVSTLAGTPAYVTVDLDCLRAEEAVTNWENGLFTAGDVAWAIGRLRESSEIVGGDVCGAYSRPRMERWTQRLASWWDHPKFSVPAEGESRRRNLAAVETIWAALVG